MIQKMLASVAAAALVVSVPAQAAADASAPLRTPAEVEGSEQLFGGGLLLPIIIVVAIGLGLYFALEEDDEPASP